jgi:uracil phosphoribosyltransferase
MTKQHASKTAVCCSSEFALRPYLYLIVHWPVVKAAAIATGTQEFKFLAFYALRVVLSLISATLDARFARCEVPLKCNVPVMLHMHDSDQFLSIHQSIFRATLQMHEGIVRNTRYSVVAFHSCSRCRT